MFFKVFGATDMATEETYFLITTAFLGDHEIVLFPHQEINDPEVIVKDILQSVQKYKLVNIIIILL